MKVLIYIKNNDSKCFLWFLIRHLNPLKIHSERNVKANKNMVNDLDYKTVKFLEKILASLKRKIIFPLILFVVRLAWFNLCIGSKF